MESMRQKMLNGEKVPGCIRCYQEENAGKKSLRERYHDSEDLPIDQLVDLENPTIRWIELAISNDCNLACRMCDSRYSWKWFKEEQVIYGKTYNTVERSKSDISNVYPFIDKLVHLKFTGGEPLATADHWKLLDKVLNERDCSEIMLNYSTNCTIMPKKPWVEKWMKFKKVEFALSFDSANKAESEYIRWPSQFENTVAVTERFLELKRTHGFDSLLRSTISILNVWYMPETLEWWLERDPGPAFVMNPTHLTFPEILGVTVLPQALKLRVEEKFENFKRTSSFPQISKHLDYIRNHMFSKDDSHLLPKLKSYLDKTDAYRNQSFAESYPHFREIVATN